MTRARETSQLQSATNYESVSGADELIPHQKLLVLT